MALSGACRRRYAADAAFQNFLQSLWPEAQKLGVSRATFDAATRGLEPDLSLPDLVIPGRPDRPPPAQAEFVQTPADYVREKTIARLAAQGRKLADQHRATLDGHRAAIRRAAARSSWRSGAARPPMAATSCRTTRCACWRRRPISAAARTCSARNSCTRLKMLQDGHVKLADMRSSWAGAMGLTQFLPSEFYKHAVDFDGDGRRDIFNSVPDALASAAQQLVDKGWQPGKRWAYEVRVAGERRLHASREPGHACRSANGSSAASCRPMAASSAADELPEEASLLMPEGSYGPAFLTPKNYFVIKDYNFSDLYVLFVGHLSDRIVDARPFETPWSKTTQLRTAQVEAMQRTLTERGLYRDKIDGKAGMLTRSALGAYQKANGLKLDCWPTAAVLDHMQGRAAN